MARQLLVAYDESPQAAASLEHALETYPEAEIVVIHVTDPREWVYPDDLGGSYYATEAMERAQASAEELLATAEGVAEDAGRTVTTVAEVGQPATAIVDYAAAHGIDHIVTGSHGRRGLSRFLLGSVAERVVRRSPVSVTVVREADDEPAD